jgi:putative sterol carrier protein
MLTLPYELCYKALLQNDTKEAMKGFLTRKIRVKGNMTEMLTLASIKSEGDLEALRVKVCTMTEPVS